MFFSKEITNLAKGIAIILVIVSHFLLYFTNDYFFSHSLGALGVFIFLFLSSYGVSASSSHLTYILLVKRVFKIYIYYFYFSILKIFLMIIFDYGVHLKDIIGILTFTNKGMRFDATMWYIPYIILSYLYLHFIFLFSEKFIANIILIGICSLYFSVLFHYVVVFLAYPLGYLAYHYREDHKVVTKDFLLIILLFYLFILAVYFYFYFLLHSFNGYYLYSSFSKIIFYPVVTVSMIILIEKVRLPLTVFMRIGSISFPLYLLEGFPLYNKFMFNNLSIESNPIFYILYIAGSLFIAYVMTTKVKKKRYIFR